MPVMVRLEVVEGTRTVWLPVPAPPAVVLRAGLRAIEGVTTSLATSFGAPVLSLTADLAAVLGLPLDLPYQLKVDSGNVELGPVIGFLLGNYNHRYSPSHMNKYSDRFSCYESIGGLVIAFSTRCIDWEQRMVYGLYYQPKLRQWQMSYLPLPKVVYRRDFHSSHEDIIQLRRITGENLFNSIRFSKWELYQYLTLVPYFRDYLPATIKVVNLPDCLSFIDSHREAILKPAHLSRGRGICLLAQRQRDLFQLWDYRHYPVAISYLNRSDLSYWLATDILPADYIMQQFLRLALIEGRPFDIRVVQQKQGNLWQCSGIECRVAGPQQLITNISRGGRPMPLRECLRRVFEGSLAVAETTANIKRVCQLFCKSMESLEEHFAEFGVDLGIDREGKLWFIEANVFPAFNGFKNVNYDNYLYIRSVPLLYAAEQAGFPERTGRQSP